MESFNKLLKNRKSLIFLDFEGTQFSHEIIAIGALKTELCDGVISKEYTTFKRYVKSYGPIGKIVSSMTSIDNQTLIQYGITLEQMFDEFKDFVGEDFSSCAFIVFGTNDVKMIIDSIKLSSPSNEKIGIDICKNTIDFLAFISQYIRDENGNNYSLVNYLKVFNIEPYGQSHDPLNDAIDLMNLTNAFLSDKQIKNKEYRQILKKQKIYPQPIKRIINRLLNGEVVTPEEFDKEIEKYLV